MKNLLIGLILFALVLSSCQKDIMEREPRKEQLEEILPLIEKMDGFSASKKRFLSDNFEVYLKFGQFMRYVKITLDTTQIITNKTLFDSICSYYDQKHARITKTMETNKKLQKLFENPKIQLTYFKEDKSVLELVFQSENGFGKQLKSIELNYLFTDKHKKNHFFKSFTLDFTNISDEGTQKRCTYIETDPVVNAFFKTIPNSSLTKRSTDQEAELQLHLMSGTKFRTISITFSDGTTEQYGDDSWDYY